MYGQYLAENFPNKSLTIGGTTRNSVDLYNALTNSINEVYDAVINGIGEVDLLYANPLKISDGSAWYV